MSLLDFSCEQRDGYAVVRVQGDPSLDQFLAFIKAIGGQSASWPVRRALFDLRSVRTLTAFTEHYAVGAAAATHLPHMERIASVVPADRITRASEKTARGAGLELRVFVTEAEAIGWLTGA